MRLNFFPAITLCTAASLVAMIPFLLFVARGLAQNAAANIQADSGLPHDSRPPGKYLVEICTQSVPGRIMTCTATPSPLSPPPQLRDQSITISLACDPASKDDCHPDYPLVAGTSFFVSAAADSGLSVQQKVLSGPATPLSGSGKAQYRATGPGLIIVRATQDGDSVFAPASPVDLLLQVVPSQADAAPGCSVLPPSMAATSTMLDAPTIVTMMGNPTPFTLAAQGSNTIAVYAARQPLHPDETAILNSFQSTLAALAGRSMASLGIVPAAKPFSVELSVAHATALDDLATRINGLNYSQFTIQDVGSDKVRVNAASTPDCAIWKGFLSDLRHMEWQLISEPMSAKLFYLSSSDVATAFTSLAPAAATAPAPTPAPTASAGSAPSTSATVSVTQPPGSNITINSNTTPCVVAGLASGNPGACATALATAAAPAAAVTPAPRAPLGMASVAVAMGSGEQTPPDLLVFSDTNPGDDAQVQERLRVIAQLDWPRPEMIINAWMTQNSSVSKETMGGFINIVKGLVTDYNGEFEAMVLRGWESVKTQIATTPGFFNEPFRSYVSDRFVADTLEETKSAAGAQALAQSFLDHSQAKLADPVAPGTRTALGICERGRYCLGYITLFNPLKPNLTDLLLAIIAAQDPAAVNDKALIAVEGTAGIASDNVCDGQSEEVRSRCRAIRKGLNLDSVSPAPSPQSCTDEDFRGILASLVAAPHEPRVHLRCFSAQVRQLMAASGAAPYPVGLLRAALADFLFNYKMSQQYPHEFTPYDLSHSADALNAALSPLIDAFNRDLWSFQLFVRADVQYRVERLNARTDERGGIKRVFGVDKPSFFNDGLITVRTISGQWTYVNTTSQSFLNTSTAPELNTLLSSLGNSNTNSTGAGSLAGKVLSAGPLGRTEALAGALSNYQTTFAQIGRSLMFSAFPRSLSAASSAEIAVSLNADESAGGPAYTGGGASDPAQNTSRVANHDTATRVRVDSVKLFEISSLTAIVERSRSRFPLLPPFVEIPYIGTLAGVPLPAAKEYHSSTAIMSAYVVPTAADIAYGLRFANDLVVDALNPGPCSFFKGAAGPNVPNSCIFKKALSLRDFSDQPVNNFNKEIIRCFAKDPSQAGCRSVSFDGVPQTN